MTADRDLHDIEQLLERAMHSKADHIEPTGSAQRGVMNHINAQKKRRRWVMPTMATGLAAAIATVAVVIVVQRDDDKLPINAGGTTTSVSTPEPTSPTPNTVQADAIRLTPTAGLPEELVAIDQDGRVGVWSTSTGKLLRVLHEGDRTAPPSELTISPDGEVVFFADGDHVVAMLTNGSKLAEIEGRCPQVSHDGNYLSITRGDEIDVFAVEPGAMQAVDLLETGYSSGTAADCAFWSPGPEQRLAFAALHESQAAIDIYQVIGGKTQSIRSGVDADTEQPDNRVFGWTFDGASLLTSHDESRTAILSVDATSLAEAQAIPGPGERDGLSGNIVEATTFSRLLEVVVQCGGEPKGSCAAGRYAVQRVDPYNHVVKAPEELAGVVKEPRISVDRVTQIFMYVAADGVLRVRRADGTVALIGRGFLEAVSASLPADSATADIADGNVERFCSSIRELQATFALPTGPLGTAWLDTLDNSLDRLQSVTAGAFRANVQLFRENISSLRPALDKLGYDDLSTELGLRYVSLMVVGHAGLAPLAKRHCNIDLVAPVIEAD